MKKNIAKKYVMKIIERSACDKDTFIVELEEYDCHYTEKGKMDNQKKDSKDLGRIREFDEPI